MKTVIDIYSIGTMKVCTKCLGNLCCIFRYFSLHQSVGLTDDLLKVYFLMHRASTGTSSLELL